jgi:hypothetical protein
MDAHEPAFLEIVLESADFTVGSTACPWGSLGMSRCPPSPGPRADRPARHQETGMGRFEQDWLELAAA